MFSRSMQNKNICHSSQLLEQQTVCQARKEIGGCTKPNTLLHLSSCPCGKPPNFCQHVIRSSQIAVTLLLSANEYEQVITRWQLSWMISPRNSLRVLALESATLLGHPVWPTSILTTLVLFLRPNFCLANPNCGCHKIAYDNSGGNWTRLHLTQLVKRPCLGE